MSGIPSRPPPIPNGVAALPKVGSKVPRGWPFIGEPMSKPWEPPEPTGLQSTPVVSPACSQLLGIMVLKDVPSPGKERRLLAMLLAAPSFRNWGVSAQVLFVDTELFLSVS